MATEPLQAAPYAVGTDAPDGPAQLLALASWARRQVVQIYASAAARTAAFTAASISPAEGMVSWLQDVNRHEYHDGVAWVPLNGRVARSETSANLPTGAAGAEAVGSGSGLAVTAALVSGRRYRVTVSGAVNTATTGDVIQVLARYSTGTVTTGSSSATPAGKAKPVIAGGPGQVTLTAVMEFTAPSTATFNIALTVATSSGSGISTLLSPVQWEVLDVT